MCRHNLLIIVPFIILAFGLTFLATNVPVQDDYDAILAYLNFPWPERFFHLADFHNEHRVITTRLVSELVYQILGHVDFRVLIWIGNIGWWIFAVAFARLFIKPGEISRRGAIFTCWMLVGFYDHENIFLSLSAIANHWVLVFAFAACLAFSKRVKLRWFSAALAFAVAATFTSGGGLLVFPALVLMAFHDYLTTKRWSIDRRQLQYIVSFSTIMTVSVVLFLYGFPHNGSSQSNLPTELPHRILNATEFFFSFFGNLMPFTWAAFPLGVGIVGWGLYISYYVPRYRGTSVAIFAFLSFCVANILAATVFRGNSAASAIPGRYRLISVAIIVSLLYLTLVETPLPLIFKKKLLSFAVAGSLVLSSIYLVRGVSYNFDHRTALETGLAKWPKSNDGLDYPSNDQCQVHASDILRDSVSNGIFVPHTR